MVLPTFWKAEYAILYYISENPPPLQPIAEIERKTTLTSDAHLIVKIG